MSSITELDKLTRSSRRREFEDGLMDFVFGAIFLFISLFGSFFFSSIGLRWYLTSVLQNRTMTILGLIISLLLLFACIAGAKRMIERVRRNLLWKYQGFVKSLRWQVSWQINALAVSVLIAMLMLAVWFMSMGFISQVIILRTLVSATGVASGIIFWGMGRELELHRYQWVGAAGGVLSIFIILMPISFSVSWLAFGIVWTLVLSISGFWALRKTLAALGEQNRA